MNVTALQTRSQTGSTKFFFMQYPWSAANARAKHVYHKSVGKPPCLKVDCNDIENIVNTMLFIGKHVQVLACNLCNSHSETTVITIQENDRTDCPEHCGNPLDNQKQMVLTPWALHCETSNNENRLIPVMVQWWRRRPRTTQTSKAIHTRTWAHPGHGELGRLQSDGHVQATELAW